MWRWTGPGIMFLISLGFEVSPISDWRLSIFLWGIAVLWGLMAVITWGPIKSWLRNEYRNLVIFGMPKSMNPPAVPYVLKWYIPISLKKSGQIPGKTISHCQVKLFFINRKNYPFDTLKMRSQSNEMKREGNSEFTLIEGNDPIMIPIAIRAENRAWDQLSEWETRMIDQEYLVRQNPIPVPSNEYEFTLKITVDNQTIASKIYKLNVPDKGIGNDKFTVI